MSIARYARYGCAPEFHNFLESNPIKIDRGSVVGRTAMEGRLFHIQTYSDPEYTRHDAQRVMAAGTYLGVPLLREGTPQ